MSADFSLVCFDIVCKCVRVYFLLLLICKFYVRKEIFSRLFCLLISEIYFILFLLAVSALTLPHMLRMFAIFRWCAGGVFLVLISTHYLRQRNCIEVLKFEIFLQLIFFFKFALHWFLAFFVHVFINFKFSKFIYFFFYFFRSQNT